MSKNLSQKVEDLRHDLELLRESVNSILDGGMREKTILVLMSHYTGLPQKTVKRVMYGMHDLEFEYFGGAEE